MGLDNDPDLVAVVISAVNAPDGIRAGDRIDLAVAVSDIRSADTLALVPPADLSPLSLPLPGLAGTEEILPLATPTETPTPTPTATPTATPTSTPTTRRHPLGQS